MLDEVVGKNESRIDTGIAELNRVLGGGLVNGSLVLLGGEIRIGKSTLILELCDKITGNGKVLYISRRIGRTSKNQGRQTGNKK